MGVWCYGCESAGGRRHAEQAASMLRPTATWTKGFEGVYSRDLTLHWQGERAWQSVGVRHHLLLDLGGHLSCHLGGDAVPTDGVGQVSEQGERTDGRRGAVVGERERRVVHRRRAVEIRRHGRWRRSRRTNGVCSRGSMRRLELVLTAWVARLVMIGWGRGYTDRRVQPIHVVVAIRQVLITLIEGSVLWVKLVEREDR